MSRPTSRPAEEFAQPLLHDPPPVVFAISGGFHHQPPDETGKGLNGAGARGSGELSLLCAGLIIMQEAGHPWQHPHGADGFDVAQEGFEPVLALRPGGARSGEGLAGHNLIEHRQPEQDS